MNTTTQTGFGFAPMFSVEPGCFVEWKGETWIVIALYDANIDGRIPALATNVKDGRDGMPFVDELKVTKPATHRRPAADPVSQETAERFADWNRRGNAR